MLNQRPNSDGDPVLPTERTYTYMIYKNISLYTKHHISRARTHKSF